MRSTPHVLSPGRKLVWRWGSRMFVAATLQTGGTPARAAPVDLRIEPDSSRVEYHITNPLGDVTNVAGRPEGEVHADSARAMSLAGRVTVDLRELATGIGMRDRHVKSAKYLDVQGYPLAEFALAGVEPDTVTNAAGEAASPGGTPAIARGTLQLHGVAQDVRIPISMLWQQGRLRVHGSFTLLLADYGIPRPRRLFLVAGKNVDVRLHLLFVP